MACQVMFTQAIEINDSGKPTLLKISESYLIPGLMSSERKTFLKLQ